MEQKQHRYEYLNNGNQISCRKVCRIYEKYDFNTFGILSRFRMYLVNFHKYLKLINT